MPQKLTDAQGMKNILTYFSLGEREFINYVIDTVTVRSDFVSWKLLRKLVFGSSAR